MKINPAKNPPICAHQAMFVSSSNLKMQFKNCKIIQTERNTKAGMRKRRIKINVFIFALGKIIRYEPKTPEIAPLAPMIGMRDSWLKTTWTKLAATPQIR